MKKVYCAVKAIITKENEFLVIHQRLDDIGYWDLPGGRVKYGESPYDTLKREVKEETNLDVEIEKPAGMFWFFRKTDGAQVVCNTFFCKIAGGEIDLSKNPIERELESITEFRWVTKNEFLQEEYTTGRNSSLKQLIEESLS